MSEYHTTDNTMVLADSDSFFEKLTADVQNAEKSVRIQCMSFEADSVGIKLIELLNTKPNIDRILLIDHYSLFVVNDTFLNAPNGWMNKNNARSERKGLDRLINSARESGIIIKFTNPMGFLMHRYPVRNHKKMVLIDDQISYLGGVNFTEHNFRWTDLMIRHDDSDLNFALSKSFHADLHETTAEVVTKPSEAQTLYNLNGFQSRNAYSELMKVIKDAQKIVVVSPYITFPMLDAISNVPDNTVILPSNNNKPFVRFIHGLKRYKKVNFKYAEGNMVHTKLMILDDSIAIYGSSNFDFVSYFFEKEVVLLNKDKSLCKKLNLLISDLIN